MNKPAHDVTEGPQGLVTVAVIARPQGIRGEVIADLTTDFPERLTERKQVWLGKSETTARLAELEKVRLHLGRVLLKFKGCDSRNDAEAFRDLRVMVERETLAALPANEFFHFDLIGCAIVTRDGQTLGEVSKVQDFGAAPLLIVMIDEREVMIPLADSICVEVDTARKRIVVELPDGLLDL